jgi:NAD(P)-dependent dehydrogenase (short-subunit alcohol dehydrogenase family)
MSTESVSAPVALVTGADKGIGLETARRLARARYRAYLTARSDERGRAAAATPARSSWNWT